MKEQQAWINRVLSGTWTPEYLVPELKASQESTLRAIEEFMASGDAIEDKYTRERRP